tara:strand:+ start:1151 stop:1924 length:774 start_codon:yes stop_codon:yes gene_type:complete
MTINSKPQEVERISFIGCPFDRMTQSEVLARFGKRTGSSPFSFVVTPNVDHVVTVNQDKSGRLRRIYDQAELSLCDSRIVQKLAKSAGIDLPLVTGSDLSVTIVRDLLQDGDRVSVIGLEPDDLDVLRSMFPHVTFDHHSPPFGFLDRPEELQKVIDFIEAAPRRFHFLSIGAPKSEIVASIVTERGRATGTALCCGASLLFLCGTLKRAPQIIQRLHLEWLFRLASEPRRLFHRYVIKGPAIFGYFLSRSRFDAKR